MIYSHRKFIGYESWVINHNLWFITYEQFLCNQKPWTGICKLAHDNIAKLDPNDEGYDDDYEMIQKFKNMTCQTDVGAGNPSLWLPPTAVTQTVGNTIVTTQNVEKETVTTQAMPCEQDVDRACGFLENFLSVSLIIFCTLLKL